jgi:hypothetical protein
MKKRVVFCTWIVLAVCVMNGATAQEGLYKVTNAENLASEKLVEKITSTSTMISAEVERMGLSPERTEVETEEMANVLAAYLMENVSPTELTAGTGVPQRVEITAERIVFTTEGGDTVRTFTPVTTEASTNGKSDSWVFGCERGERLVLRKRNDCRYVLDVPKIGRLDLTKLR